MAKPKDPKKEAESMLAASVVVVLVCWALWYHMADNTLVNFRVDHYIHLMLIVGFVAAGANALMALAKLLSTGD